MSQDEIKISASKLILKINFITGWALREDQESQQFFKEEFELKLVESYPTVNLDEMIFAFRNNTTVKDWGKYMNLALIDEVMIPYLQQRREVSKIEEQEKIKELPAPKDDPMTDEEFIEMNFKTWQVLKNYGIISTRCYGILVKQYKINLVQAEKDEMYRQVEIFLKERMLQDQELKNLYNSMNKNHWKERVFNECKRKAVELYFQTL